MLAGKNITVIGGDDRYLQVIDYLADQRADVFVIGFKDIEFYHLNIHHAELTEVEIELMDGIVLPINGTDESGKISTFYGEMHPTLTKDILEKTKPDCVVYTGTAGNYLRNLLAECNRKLVILIDRDDVAIANSIPTAEAALQIAMDQTKYTIHGANVLVVGFGRIGITIARLFQNVGADVTVAARKQGDFARIREMKMKPISMNNLANGLLETDICINTVPTLVLTEEVMKDMNEEGLIIDLASKPGGTDFAAAEQLGIQAIHALGLPGKVAPKTAGLILGETIAELVAGWG